MDALMQSYKREIVNIEISGGKLKNGALIDSSSEMLVIYNGEKFVYIPLEHIKTFHIDFDNEDNIQLPTEAPSIGTSKSSDDMTLKQILTQAKGKNVEIFVTGDLPLHGTITSVMKDYFVFESPIYKTIFIPSNHLKWLIPYNENHLLYDLMVDQSYQKTNNQPSYAGNFSSQLEQFRNKLVVLNLGEKITDIGKLNNLNSKIVEVVLADSKFAYSNITHIKTIQVV
ncbi:DUF2642 domain-containing protein [Ureibacillus aquaedulcis]|uniref:DUF2642 domain-containing protein n=1 Tax=Ureibacillus aquaedulcis TaxID=3058421 RepID=A0ABT8GMV8_9BACL|nr:DUF2642 domain-containing protein [Ureibacillus sp. BA0131]MDN4492745.1 DUF2642 domain-containing protein [Ureibacillus sp. BA0131]